MITNRPLPKDGNGVWKVTTSPLVEPITTDEVKLFARIDGTEEDTLISSFITAARINCEKYLGRALISQTLTLKMDYWPGEVIKLPRPPLISITAVETLDEDDNVTTYNASNYYIIVEDIPGKLILKQSASPPFQSVRNFGGYQVRFVAGYGLLGSDVPSPIREGLKLWTTSIYENRVVMEKPPPEATSLLNMFRVLNIGEVG